MMQTLTGLSAAPLLPWWAIAALGAVAVAIVALALWRRARGAWWRALALATALVVLINPAVVEETREGLADVTVLVIDRSPSQGIGARRAQTDAAVIAFTRAAKRLPNLDLRVVTAGAGEHAAATEGTRLFAALSETLADVPKRRLAGVVMVTDGEVHDAPTAKALAARLGSAPLHVLLTGARGERDRRLVIEQAPRYGIVGDPLSLRLRVDDAGSPAQGGLARVTVRRDHQPEETIVVPVGKSREVPFVLDRAGPGFIELSVEDGPNELSRINNRAVVEVNGVRDRLRVLLVSGEAHPGERVWRNLLKADPSVDLVHFTILRPPEKQDTTPIRELALISFPIRELFETKLDQFDLIIFDRYRRRGVVPMTYIGNIARYVEKGGALLTATGPAFAGPLSLYRTPLRTVLPAEPTGEVLEGGFRALLTAAGRRHPVTAGLPKSGGETPSWGRWFRQIDADVNRGTVLMEGARARPILILDRVGEGRVAQLLTDHLWLWARGFEGGGPQAELLRRLAHWLMKEPELEEEALRATADGRRIDIVRRSLEARPRTVTVTAPSGAIRRVALADQGDGRATASLTVDEPGLYRLADGAEKAIAVVGDLNPVEYTDLRATDAVLGPLAAASGGGVVWLADGTFPSVRKVKPGRDAAGAGWLGLRANGDYIVTGVRQASLMPPWLALVLTLGGLLLAWRAEGR